MLVTTRPRGLKTRAHGPEKTTSGLFLREMTTSGLFTRDHYGRVFSQRAFILRRFENK